MSPHHVRRARPPRKVAGSIFRRSWLAVAIAEVAFLAMLGTHLTNVVAGVKLPELPEIAPPPQTSRLLDARGRLIAYLHGEQDRIVVDRSKMAPALVKAVLAAEDSNFYRHGGLDAAALVRAALANAKEGDTVQGASTITQQYVRNAFPSVGTEKTMERKIREALLAVKLEQELSKDEILDLYLNAVYFGRGAYGVEAAARTYFGKNAKDLALHEAAFLATVIKTPIRYGEDQKAGKIRRDYVLGRMASLGWAPRAEVAKATKQPLGLRPDEEPPARAAYFVEHVRRLLLAPANEGGFGLTVDQVFGGGLTVYTTLDLDYQRAAENAYRAVLPNASDPEAALVSMTTSGEIRAMVGGRHFTSIEKARGFNYAAQAAIGAGRTAGSTFKPFTLLAYLRAGYSPRDMYRAPSKVRVNECPNADETPWQPSNYGNNAYGVIDVVKATQDSVNTVYAQMVGKVGGKAAAVAARDAGITSPLLPVCAIALGTFGVTPLEMARAYSTFATRGERPTVVSITRIEGPDGTVLAERAPRLERTVELEIADQINAVLASVVTNGTGRPAAIQIPSAGKTGTTQNRQDAWYVGYTPHPGITTAVWMGYTPDAKGRIRLLTTLRGRQVTGGGFAGAIWRNYMSAVMRDAKPLQFTPVTFDPPKVQVQAPPPPEAFPYPHYGSYTYVPEATDD